MKLPPVLHFDNFTPISQAHKRSVAVAFMTFYIPLRYVIDRGKDGSYYVNKYKAQVPQLILVP